MTEALIVFTAFANEEDAVRAVRALVEERLIAGANLIPGARSLYLWKGEVKDEREVVVLMKSRKQDWPALMSRLHDLHPYDTPECIAVRIAAGAPRYMAWLEETLSGGERLAGRRAWCSASRLPATTPRSPFSRTRDTCALTSSPPRICIGSTAVS